jgi:hypothetical protein
MTREEFLHLLSLSPETGADETEYLFDREDGTWHVAWDEADEGKREVACGRVLPAPTTGPPREPVQCPRCVEHLDLCKRIDERRRRHFLDVTERMPILIRDDDHTWVAPEFAELSNRAMGLLIEEAERLNAHVYAIPGDGWDLVPAEAEPDLAERLMLEERAWQEIH